MAYREPAFVFNNMIREYGGITSEKNSGSSIVTPATLRLLTDDFYGNLYTAEDQITPTDYYTVWYWSNTDSLQPDIFIIPAGHNLEPVEVGVDEKRIWIKTPAWRSRINITTSNSEPVVIDPLVDDGAGAGGDGQVLIGLDTSLSPTAFTPSIGEFVLGNKVTLSRGPDPGWTYSRVSQVERYTTKAGVTSQWLLGRPRKTWQLTWHNLEAADLALIDQLYTKASGGGHPFWFLPPDDAHNWTPVELVSDAEVSNSSRVPLAKQMSEVTLKMIEVMG